MHTNTYKYHTYTCFNDRKRPFLLMIIFLGQFDRDVVFTSTILSHAYIRATWFDLFFLYIIFFSPRATSLSPLSHTHMRLNGVCMCVCICFPRGTLGIFTPYKETEIIYNTTYTSPSSSLGIKEELTSSEDGFFTWSLSRSEWTDGMPKWPPATQLVSAREYWWPN